MGMRQPPQASSVSQDGGLSAGDPAVPAVRPPARLPAAMAVWLRPYQVSPSTRVCLMSTGILTTSSALSSRLKALTRAMYFRISGPFLPEEGPALRQIRSGGLPDAGSQCVLAYGGSG